MNKQELKCEPCRKMPDTGEVFVQSMVDWYDYEQQKAIALPPVGLIVQMRRHGEDFVGGKLLFAGSKLVVVLHQETEISLRHYSIEFRPLDYATRAKELELEKLANNIVGINFDGYVMTKSTAISMAKQGFLKLP